MDNSTLILLLESNVYDLAWNHWFKIKFAIINILIILQVLVLLSIPVNALWIHIDSAVFTLVTAILNIVLCISVVLTTTLFDRYYKKHILKSVYKVNDLIEFSIDVANNKSYTADDICKKLKELNR